LNDDTGFQMSTPKVETSMMSKICTSRNYREWLEKTISTYPYVVFYGCGNSYPSILHAWNKAMSRKVDMVCDRNSEKWDTPQAEVPCISPASLEKIKNECIVFLTLGHVDEAAAFLTEKGFPAVFPLYKYDLQYWAENPALDLGELNRSLSNARECFSDQRSREIFDAVATRIFCGNDAPDGMARICEPAPYFARGVVNLTAHESFVDAGAFDGDTLEEFLNYSGGCFDNYYAFELCGSNCSRLKKVVSRMREKERIEVFEAGLGNIRETVRYDSAAMETNVGTGDEVGEIFALDDVLKDRKVTFVKMDIEGFEWKALHGAENTIRTRKPILAVCVYHRASHLWEIPLYLKSLLPEYRIYMRHHSQLGYETVCYAVPEGR